MFSVATDINLRFNCSYGEKTISPSQYTGNASNGCDVIQRCKWAMDLRTLNHDRLDTNLARGPVSYQKHDENILITQFDVRARGIVNIPV